MKFSDSFEAEVIGLSVSAPNMKRKDPPSTLRQQQLEKEWEGYSIRLFSLLGEAIAKMKRCNL